MTKETKVKLLQVILNAGIKGTDREMLDNLKAVIKSIEGEGVSPVIKENSIKADLPVATIRDAVKKKVGRPFKKR